MRVLVIGAGIFGSCIASELAYDGHEVVLCEKNNDIMESASRANHNRIHFGYHYPRSTLTAKQSLDSMLSFYTHFKDAIITNFPNYYAIAADGSNVSGREFMMFCDEVGISYKVEYPHKELLDPAKLETCLKVNEPIFDFDKLKRLNWERLVESGVRVYLATGVIGVEEDPDEYVVSMVNAGRKFENAFDFVINASYGSLNKINKIFGVEEQPLLFQDVIIPVFRKIMGNVGLTIMDGKYCTIMPRGGRDNEFLLYHVVDSVMSRGNDAEKLGTLNATGTELTDQLAKIYKNSTEYMPFLRNVQGLDYYRTTRTFFDNKSDARLSEIQTYQNDDTYISVLSGKISTAMKTAIQIRTMLAKKQSQTNYLI